MNRKSVYRQSVNVNLENGLHLVPCSRIAQSAAGYDCDVEIHKGDMFVDAKNIFDLMSLNAGHGTTLILQARGDGAAEAIDELVRLFQTDFQGDHSDGDHSDSQPDSHS